MGAGGSWSQGGHRQPGSRGRGSLALTHLSPFYSIQDPSSWNSVVLIWGWFSAPTQMSFEIPSQMYPDVCFHWNSSLPQVGKIHLHQGLRGDYENTVHKGEEQRWKPPGVLYHPTHVVTALTCLLGVGGSLCQGCPCLPDSIPSVLLMVCMRCI